MVSALKNSTQRPCAYVGDAGAKWRVAFLRGVSLTLIAAKAVGLGFIILVIWKAYKEYWKPHNARTEKKP